MELIILIIAAALEIALAAYYIKMKVNDIKFRNIAYIGAFSLFVILTLVSTIKWSFRWYFFAILLFIWAIFAVIPLIWSKYRIKEYKTKSVVIKLVFKLLIILIALTPAFVFKEYVPIETTGEYKVSTSLYTYEDVNRIETYTNTGENRKVNVQFWYPENVTGTYPLVVFSHGGSGVKTSNESLYRELASNGYVVGSIDHTYHSFFTKSSDGKVTLVNMGFIMEFGALNTKTNIEKSYEYIKKWMKIRTDDMNFVLDNILEYAKSDEVDQVYKIVDSNKIGVFGHSLGGSAALALGRYRDDISAVMALESPFLGDITGIENDKFNFVKETYPIPVLNIYSDSTWGKKDPSPEYEENIKLMTDTEATAFNVYIKGSRHFSLTDLAITSPYLTSMLDGQASEVDTYYCLKTINQLSLNFFDCYLKKQGEFAPKEMY